MSTHRATAERAIPRTDDWAVERVSPALPESVSVTLWLRGSTATAARERQDHVEARVAALDEGGVETTVRKWPKRVTAPRTEHERTVVATFDRYRAVAGMQGVRLDPFFECRSTPDGARTVRFPVACLALERDGDLTGIYPCFDGDEHVTVADGLEAAVSGGAENLR